VIESIGPTNTRRYSVAVYFRGERLTSAEGHSIQEAEMNAAKTALETCSDLFPHLDYQRKIVERSFQKQNREQLAMDWRSEVLKQRKKLGMDDAFEEKLKERKRRELEEQLEIVPKRRRQRSRSPEEVAPRPHKRDPQGTVDSQTEMIMFYFSLWKFK
jgi:hypothetical protein